jgi:hypothetical protein
MHKFRAIQDHVVFQFDQDTTTISDGQNSSVGFQENTDWGFKYSNFNESLNVPRWATVISIGPAVSNAITVGMHILIEPLKWTPGVNFNNTTYWRTIEKYILGYE